MPDPEAVTVPFESFLEVLAPGKESDLDIVAVHGLNPTDDPSHATKTWTAGDKMWLKDFLPNDLPNARIMLFGYNANIAFEKSTAGIHDQAESLLQKLDLERLDLPDQMRPIIFIAHSLGGLVVKQAILRGNNGNDYKHIPEATHGIAFFATPHQGSDIGKLGEIAAIISKEVNQNPSSSLLETMKKDSLYSNQLAEDFRHHLSRYEFLSFYELRSSKETGCLIVDKRSSTLGAPGDRERQIPMEADHTSICKFASADSHNYKDVKRRLIQMAKNAAQEVEKKKNQEDNHSKPPAYSSNVDSSKLLEACSRGDMDDVRSFIKSGADVNFQGAKGYTALMIAVEKDNFEMVELLLGFNAKVEGSLEAEKSPLGVAIANRSLEMVELLLNNKADPNADSVYLSKIRALPLGQAVFAGNEEIVRLLLDRDANPNAIPQHSLYGWTPLHIALKKPSKDEKIIEYLLEYGAKIDNPCAKGETVVDYINGLQASSRVASSKGLPLMPQLQAALSNNLFSEVASVLASEIRWGLRFGNEGKKYGKDLVIKFPDGRLHPLTLPLNLGAGAHGTVSTPTGAFEMPVLPTQYPHLQQQPALNTNLPMRSYTNPHGSGIHELSPQQYQAGVYQAQPPQMPYGVGNPPMRSYSDPHGAVIQELSPQQQQGGIYQPQHMQCGTNNLAMGSYNSPQWNQPAVHMGPPPSSLLTRSYTSPQAAEVLGSIPPTVVSQEREKKKNLLGKIKGKFK